MCLYPTHRYQTALLNHSACACNTVQGSTTWNTGVPLCSTDGYPPQIRLQTSHIPDLPLRPLRSTVQYSSIQHLVLDATDYCSLHHLVSISPGRQREISSRLAACNMPVEDSVMCRVAALRAMSVAGGGFIKHYGCVDHLPVDDTHRDLQMSTCCRFSLEHGVQCLHRGLAG